MGFDLCLIETMPMGEIAGERTDQYLPLSIGALAATAALDAGRRPTTGPVDRRGISTSPRPVGGSASSRR